MTAMTLHELPRVTGMVKLESLTDAEALVRLPLGALLVLPDQSPFPIAHRVTANGFETVYLKEWPKVGLP